MPRPPLYPYAYPFSEFDAQSKPVGVTKFVVNRMTGNIKGLARRKGESNPFKWGFEVDESVLGNPAWQNSKTLPPRKAPKIPKEPGENKGPGFLGKLFGKKK